VLDCRCSGNAGATSHATLGKMPTSALSTVRHTPRCSNCARRAAALVRALLRANQHRKRSNPTVSRYSLLFPPCMPQAPIASPSRADRYVLPLSLVLIDRYQDSRPPRGPSLLHFSLLEDPFHWLPVRPGPQRCPSTARVSPLTI
jgi:hypothetical protein